MRLNRLATLLCLPWLAAAAPHKPANPATTPVPPVALAIDIATSGAGGDENSRARNGALLAIAEANDAGGLGGHPITLLDTPGPTGTTPPDQADAANRARALVDQKTVLAVIGPDQSDRARPMLPILNEADLAMVSPAASDPSLTSVRDAETYRPTGRLTFFRLVAPDGFQAIGLADFWAERRHPQSAYTVDDGSAYGVSLASKFRQRAAQLGMKILGHETVGLTDAASAALAARLQTLAPDAIFYGGTDAAGLPLMRALYATLPNALKGAGDGLYGPEVLTSVGFPAAAGWFIATSTPRLAASPASTPFIAAYQRKYGVMPDEYAMTGYDAAEMVLAAIKTILATGGNLTRESVRKTLAAETVETAQGVIGFDPNGDLRVKPVSIFQIHPPPPTAPDDMDTALTYLGPAPSH